MVAAQELQPNKGWRDVFPTDVLEGCDSALLLFCAGKCGAYDGAWVLEAGIPEVTAVDYHDGYLDAMSGLYPPDWDFVLSDAWEFARSSERQWDVVSVDPPSDKGDIAAKDVNLWASLAAHTLVLGGGPDDAPKAPRGFEFMESICRTDWLETLPITGHWFWRVYRRQA